MILENTIYSRKAYIIAVCVVRDGGEALTLRATNSIHLTGMGNVLAVVTITTLL